MTTVNYESLSAQMRKTLVFAKVPFDQAGIAANLDQWATNKWDLIQILRKHPQWNEDAMAIIIEERAARSIDMNDVTCKCLDIWEAMNDTNLDNQIADAWRYEGVQWNNLARRNIDSFLMSDVNNTTWGKLAKASIGQKTSRYIRQVLLKIGVPKDCEAVWKLYAELADMLNPVDVTRPMVISVNPSDYLMMSYGDNWSSCHIINPEIVNASTSHYSGQSKVGCLAYLGDACSIITYTVNNLPEDLHDLPITPRHTRQMFFWHREYEQLLQSRMYPYTHDHTLIDVRRAIMQGVFAECLSVPNLWKKKNSDTSFNTNGLQYPDYEYIEENHISTSCRSFTKYRNDHCENIGATARCVVCGNEVMVRDMVICPECSVIRYCQHCGEMINVDDPESYREINGYSFHAADGCSYWCNYHKRYEGGQSAAHIDGYGDVCHAAIVYDDKFVRLHKLGNYCWILRENLPKDAVKLPDMWVESESVAMLRGYKKCAQCGSWHISFTMYNCDEVYYCDECVHNSRVTCECGNVYFQLLAGKTCPYCDSDKTVIH